MAIKTELRVVLGEQEMLRLAALHVSLGYKRIEATLTVLLDEGGRLLVERARDRKRLAASRTPEDEIDFD